MYHHSSAVLANMNVILRIRQVFSFICETHELPNGALVNPTPGPLNASLGFNICLTWMFKLIGSPGIFSEIRFSSLITGGNRAKLPSSRWHRRGRSLREVFACSRLFATTHLSQICYRETRRHGTPCIKMTDSYLFSFFVQLSPKESPRDDGRQVCLK